MVSHVGSGYLLCYRDAKESPSFASLQPETVYSRFFIYKLKITNQELKRTTDADSTMLPSW